MTLIEGMLKENRDNLIQLGELRREYKDLQTKHLAATGLLTKRFALEMFEKKKMRLERPIPGSKEINEREAMWMDFLKKESGRETTKHFHENWARLEQVIPYEQCRLGRLQAIIAKRAASLYSRLSSEIHNPDCEYLKIEGEKAYDAALFQTICASDFIDCKVSNAASTKSSDPEEIRQFISTEDPPED